MAPRAMVRRVTWALLAPLLGPLLAAVPARAVGPPAADFELARVGGGKIKLSEFKGKVVLLLFVSDGCGACHAEIPEVSAIRQAHAASGFEVIAVVAGDMAPASALRAVPFPLAVASDEVKHAYHVPGYPLHYLIGRDFTIQAKHRGWSDGRAKILEAEVRQLLSGEDLNEQGIDLYGAAGSWEGHWIPGKDRRLRSDQLVPFLQSPDTAKREYAIDELGRRGAQDAVAMLGAIAGSAREELALRRKALAALVRIGSPDALGSYLKIARDRREPALLRQEAVFALQGVADGPGVGDALAAFLRDPEANVRMAAGAVLAARCVKPGQAAVEAALRAETNEWVQRALTRDLQDLAACP